MSYRARLRFRIAKPLNTDEVCRTISVGKHLFKISSPNKDEPLKQAKWLSANGYGFETAEAARASGERLRTALLYSSLCRHVGIDMGNDRPTSAWGKAVVDAHFHETGKVLRSNIHGLDIFPEDPPSEIVAFNMNVMVLAQADPFLGLTEKAATDLPPSLPISTPAVVLLNAALFNPEALAQLVLSISAVEMLAGGMQWSQSQTGLLERLQVSAREDSCLTPEEAAEVADSIKKMFRLSIRQGVIRLLRRLRLDAEIATWDRIYDSRSRIFHGSLHLDNAAYSQLANDAINLCGKIVLEGAKEEGLPADYRMT